MIRAPMRGKRVKAVRCHVEGHPDCEVSKIGDPPSRVGDEREWLRDVIAGDGRLTSDRE